MEGGVLNHSPLKETNMNATNDQAKTTTETPSKWTTVDVTVDGKVKPRVSSGNLYVGFHMEKREGYYTKVFVNVPETPLYMRFDLYNHSPDGFSWGYRGSGPSQLALAILANEYPKNRSLVMSVYQEFKVWVIAQLDTDASFLLSSAQIDRVVQQIVNERMQEAEEVREAEALVAPV